MSQEDLTKKPGENANGGDQNQNGAGQQPNPPVQTTNSGADEEDDAGVLALKGQVEEGLKNKKKGASDEKKFSERDFEEFAKRMQAQFSKGQENNDDDFVDILDPDAKKRKFVRVARLNGKFVVGLKNFNTDPYIDTPVYFTYIENPLKKGDLIPWATFVYSDGTEELYPYLSFMTRASGVWAEVIDEKPVDVSEKFGTVEVKVFDEEHEWNQKGTGKKVLAKALKYDVTYVVQEIKEGAKLEVSQDVINKVEAPYPELQKFIQATK